MRVSACKLFNKKKLNQNIVSYPRAQVGNICFSRYFRSIRIVRRWKKYFIYTRMKKDVILYTSVYSFLIARKQRSHSKSNKSFRSITFFFEKGYQKSLADSFISQNLWFQHTHNNFHCGYRHVRISLTYGRLHLTLYL